MARWFVEEKKFNGEWNACVYHSKHPPIEKGESGSLSIKFRNSPVKIDEKHMYLPWKELIAMLKMTTLSPQQQQILSKVDMEGKFSEADALICPGLHFCWDWDEMAICDVSPEKATCVCTNTEGLSKIK